MRSTQLHRGGVIINIVTAALWRRGGGAFASQDSRLRSLLLLLLILQLDDHVATVYYRCSIRDRRRERERERRARERESDLYVRADGQTEFVRHSVHLMTFSGRQKKNGRRVDDAKYLLIPICRPALYWLMTAVRCLVADWVSLDI